MGLAALKDAPRPKYKPGGCGVALWEAGLTDEQRAGLQYALDNRFPLTKIHAEALNDGFTMRYNAFRAHYTVDRVCPCGPR